MNKDTEDNFSKIEESPLKGHPLYENKEDVIFNLLKQIQELQNKLSENIN